MNELCPFTKDNRCLVGRCVLSMRDECQLSMLVYMLTELVGEVHDAWEEGNPPGLPLIPVQIVEEGPQRFRCAQCEERFSWEEAPEGELGNGAFTCSIKCRADRDEKFARMAEQRKAKAGDASCPVTCTSPKIA